jgi:hypothetical protein
MTESLNAQLRHRRQEKARRMLDYVANHAPDLLIERVRDRIENLAADLAQKAVMSYLKSEGFVHCAYCTRRSPLRIVGDKHVCESHRHRAINELRERDVVAAAG